MSDCENCDEDAVKNDGFCPNQGDVEELKRKLKSPDRAKFEREVEKLHVSIREKETKLRAVQNSRSQGIPSNSYEYKDRDALMTELRGFKAEREKEIEGRKKIDKELKIINANVQQKNDACAKLQAGLKYKTESKAEEAIRRLEHQMQAQQLKLREEKRLVLEIDALKRSKKSIHDFDALKHEISQLREKQYSLRTQRDNCMRTIAGLKSKEEEIKTALDEQRHKSDEAKQQLREYNIEKYSLKKEIDELYTHKRKIIAEFNKEKEEYSSLLKDIRQQEHHIRQEMEAMKRIEQRHKLKKLHGTDVPEHSYIDVEQERLIGMCDSLVKYLEGLTATTKSDDSEPFPEQQPNLEAADSGFTGGMFIKKKSDEDLEAMYGGAAKKVGRRSSRKGRKSAQKDAISKRLVLHPLVLNQFMTLNLSPPSLPPDIPTVLKSLLEKKANLKAAILPPYTLSRSLSSGSSSTSSIENFPSLPTKQETESITGDVELDSLEVSDSLQEANVNNNEESRGLIDDTQQVQENQKNSNDISEICVENGNLESNEGTSLLHQSATHSVTKNGSKLDCESNNEDNSSNSTEITMDHENSINHFAQEIANPKNGKCQQECDGGVLDLEHDSLQCDANVMPRELPKSVDANASIQCPS